MAKFYKTLEEGIADASKKMTTIINAYKKKKYTGLAERVTETASGFEVRGVGNYNTMKFIVEDGEMFLYIDHWDERRNVKEFNIGAIRAYVDGLDWFIKTMRINFEYVY